MTKLTLTSFHEGIKKLIGVFGSKVFTDARQDLIFNSVKVIPDKEWDALVDKMIAERKSPPLPKDFESETKNIKNRLYDEERKQNVQRRAEAGRPGCEDCNDTGILEVKHIDANFTVHFYCHCDAGVESVYHLPRWAEEYYSDYQILTSWPDRCKKMVPDGERSAMQIIELRNEQIKISEQYWEYNEQKN